MAQGHKAILWAVHFLTCFSQSQLFPILLPKPVEKASDPEARAASSHPKIQIPKERCFLLFLTLFFSQQQNYPSLVKVWHQHFPLCSSKQAMLPNISNISPDYTPHGEKAAQDPSFPSSSCSNSSFQVGMPYLVSSPPGTDMGQTQLFTLSFQKDQFDLV